MVDENKILGMLRTSFYESSLLDLIRELFQKEFIRDISLKSFKKLPVPVQDYLEGHVTAWALFELLMRLPTIQKELRDLVVGTPAKPPVVPLGSPLIPSEFRAHQNHFRETEEVVLRHGRSHRAVAALAANGEIEVATNVHIHGLLVARELSLGTLSLRGRPMIRFEEEVGYMGETRVVEHFMFRCSGCGGIFTFDNPQPRMHIVAYGPEQPMYVCQHCYKPKKEDEE